jgi:hypothetical protein
MRKSMEPARKETTQDDLSLSLSLSLSRKQGDKEGKPRRPFSKKKGKREFSGPKTSNDFIY